MASARVIVPEEVLAKFCPFQEFVTWMGELQLMSTLGFIPCLSAVTSVKTLKLEPVCLKAVVAALTWASSVSP